MIQEVISMTFEEKVAIERAAHLGTLKLHLLALKALVEFRITKRPLIVKIFTFGIVRDKHDKALEMEVAELEKTIMEWK